jgi:membrane fusion protein, heavy metal efflux system
MISGLRMPRIRIAFLLGLGLLAVVPACARRDSSEVESPSEKHAEGDHAERGPHGGRLLDDGTLRVELQIEEDGGMEPEFRAYLFDPKGRTIAPVDGRLHVVLTRFGGRRDSIGFLAEGDRFRAVRPVEEPHSYQAQVVLERKARRHEWRFEQIEYRVQLSPEAVKSSGIETTRVTSRPIEVTVDLPGEVRLNAERVLQVRPRFPGVIRGLSKRLGDGVKSGDLLATVHSNESLTDYEIHASMAGIVVARDVAAGQAVDHETVLYTVADLSTVWIDFALYPQVATQVRRGQSVRIRADAGEPLQATGSVSYVGPLLEQDTRVSYGRVVLENPGRRWQPGLFVTASITVDRSQALTTVPEEAIVRTALGPGVFRAHGTAFEFQPIEPGRSDGQWTEVRSGLEPGATIVAKNAFLLKAELGKSEATHDH